MRRNSVHRGEREHLIWRPLGETKQDAWRFKYALIRAAERFDDLTKGEQGTRIGALGLTGVKVLRKLLDTVDLMSGRLEPSIDWLAEQTVLGRRTVIRALARLKAAGFLDWMRRTEPLDNDGAGPQVRQTSNAYWFALKGRAAGLVRLCLRRAPPAPSREQVEEAARIERSGRLQAMRQGKGFDAAGVLSPEALEAVQRLKESRARRASATKAQSPGVRG